MEGRGNQQPTYPHRALLQGPELRRHLAHLLLQGRRFGVQLRYVAQLPHLTPGRTLPEQPPSDVIRHRLVSISSSIFADLI